MSAIRRRTIRHLLNLERFEDRLAPATYVVDNLTFDKSGNSLRNLVNTANANPGGDVITFAPSLTGTINFNAGDDMDINGPLTIVGPGPGVITINANGLSRIFDTSVSPAGTGIEISGLTLTGGRAIYTSPGGASDSSGVGGAVFIEDEIVTFTNCKISGNLADKSGGGIGVGVHSYLGFGSSAQLKIQSSTISGNTATAGSGGGISVYGESFGANAKRFQSLYVTESLISGNTSTWSDKTSFRGGGGVYFRGKVGPGYLAFVNTTITENKAFDNCIGGAIGVFDLDGTLALINSTVAYNQATSKNAEGIRQQDAFNHNPFGTMALFSSIVANNTTIDGLGKTDITGSFTSIVVAEKCLISVGDQGFKFAGGGGNLTGTQAAPLDAKLAPLTNNGGLIQTRMPLSNSPAIGNGSNASLTLPNDGRGLGYPRTLDGEVDIGAVEYADWVVRKDFDSGPGTLTQRIADANAFVGANTITFDPVAFPSGKSTIVSVPADDLITEALTISGPGADSLTIQRSGPANRIFNATKAPVGAAITITGVTLEGGLTTGNGGAILANNQVLNFSDCVFSKNTGLNGGAIALEKNAVGELNITRCTFDSNESQVSGGAVFFENGGRFTIDDSTFSNNQSKTGTTTSQGGGAVAFVGTASSPLLVRQSTFANNTAAGQGGAIFLNLFFGTLNVQDSTLAYNTASGAVGGGGIARFGGTGEISIDNSILSNNVHTTGTNEDLYSAGTVYGNFSAIGIPGAAVVIADATTKALLGQNFRLGTLANFGGPTLTIPLLPGSPALNAGSSTLTLDQRGKPRVGGVDIGAFESQGFKVIVQTGTPQSTSVNTPFPSLLSANVFPDNPVEPVNGGALLFSAPTSGASATFESPAATIVVGTALTAATANGKAGSYTVSASVAAGSSVNFALTNIEAPSLVVTTNADVVNNLDGVTSLREAIAFANTQAGADAITFDPAVFAVPQTISLTTGELVISDALTVTGPGAALLTINANKASRIFNTIPSPGKNITFAGMKLTGGSSTGVGGAVVAQGQTITFSDCVLAGNQAKDGGAIGLTDGFQTLLILQRCSVTGNTSSQAGGAVTFASSGQFQILDSTLSGNL